uniref:Uncharacterized protein n=1 Tax=Timema cristinae TaxID=61476 RepID=A0A7R9CII8_TIMCR|nr:unnamed protein product [Timema cristinae]
MFVCPKGARAQHYLVTSFTTTDSFLCCRLQYMSILLDGDLMRSLGVISLSLVVLCTVVGTFSAQAYLKLNPFTITPEPALREQQCSLYLAVPPSSPAPSYVRMRTTVKHHVAGTVKYTVLPSLGSTKTSSISFKIRTNEPNGLLMYSSGASTSHVLPSLGSTKTSSISFKIRTNEPNGLLMYSSGASTSHVSDDVMMVW